MADFEVRTEASRLYMAGVRAKSVKNMPPKCFSRRACAIYKRETSGQDAKSAIYKPDIAVQFR